MSNAEIVYGAVEVRQCIDKRWRKGIGFEIVDAPIHAYFVPETLAKRSMNPFAQVGPNEIITIRGVGRTIAYRMQRETLDDRLRGNRRAVKVYDDADAKEPV